MVRVSISAVLFTAAIVVQAAKKTPAIVPGAYIIEYEDNHDPNTVLNSIGADASKRMDMNYKLFKGVSIKFKDLDKAEDKAAKIADMPAVKNIWPVKLFSVPQHTVHSVGDAAGGGLSRREEADTFTPHVMTQVNQLRDKGITGKGIKIAVIDTGTDYLHPALGGCFGPGCLVSFGADLVGDAFNGSNARIPDPDPLDECNGHGSHVAGIIAAQSNNPYGIIGAAQGVTLGSYRVFGCDGDTPNDVLISAYNLAYEAGADIITASIGGPSGWSEDDWAVTVQRIVEAGVPCVVSAGNDGSEGLFYASTAANGKRVTAIASVDNTLSPALLSNATYTVNNGTNQSFGYTPGNPAKWAGVTLPLWAVNFNTADPANGCDPYPASTPDLSGYIVLIRRGTCTFVQKVTNAVNKGARYVIIYNNVAGSSAVEAVVPPVQGIAMVTADQGAEWISKLAAGSTVVVAMTDPETAPKFLVNFNNTLSPGFLSTYTSWGPTYEVDVKPQLASPGGMILSTYPRALGSYAVLSGTSMACPLTAAIYALISNVRKTKDPATIENLLSSTSNPNLFNDGRTTSPYLAPVPQQGSGLIQAYDAAYATTLLTVSSLSFNDTDHFDPVKNFSISNTGSAEVTYRLSNVGALTGYTYADDATIQPDTFPNELVPAFAGISFGPSASVTIPAGQRKIITVTATPPAGLDAKRLPVYSGYIAINGTDGSSLSLPYMGVYGSLHSVTVLNSGGTFLSSKLDTNDTAVPANRTFVLPPPGHANDTGYAGTNKTDLPKVVVELAMGSALVRVDVVPVSTCKPVNSTAILGGPGTSIGQMANSPFVYQPRGQFTAGWDGKLADGTYAPSGVYKLAVRALHIFGDAKVVGEYDATETVPFRIRYSKLGS
ncbi:subtilisin-like protein [Coniochaeta ligniaria NRRL 30616]|uniref:Subtilisin-like protein n=1 Tax=Coniochaeta ligniaria NRRL 30616 TaxID=1408157 RepID=A0A1J7J0D4_9PEZI|nr:subtilisin-like protein [Coniochaeta ligniaria NRRL 30616]